MKKALLSLLFCLSLQLHADSSSRYRIISLNLFPLAATGGRAVELELTRVDAWSIFSTQIAYMNKGYDGDGNPIHNKINGIYTKLMLGPRISDNPWNGTIREPLYEISMGLGFAAWEESHREVFKGNYYGNKVYEYAPKSKLVVTVPIRACVHLMTGKKFEISPLLEGSAVVFNRGRDETFPTLFIPGAGYNMRPNRGSAYLSRFTGRASLRIGYRFR